MNKAYCTVFLEKKAKSSRTAPNPLQKMFIIKLESLYVEIY
jgi:hypothetical protein